MIIVAYITETYVECKNLTLPSWGDNVMIFSDTDKFGMKLFNEQTTDFNENCRRKIIVIKEALKLASQWEDNDVLYLDADVLVAKPIAYKPMHDLTVTRMIRRLDREYYKEINAGVSFWKANDKTIALCDKWLELEAEYRKDSTIPYPEQRALNDLAFQGYDGLLDITVGNVSENLFNFERDDDKQFVNDFAKYKPTLVHLKGKKWQNKFILDFLRKNDIIK
jgi:hypothetical protein